MACKEFRMQAVKERVDGIAVSTFMDIRDAEMLSGNQAGFCKFVLPFVRNLAVQVPQLQAVADGIRTNLVKWDETTSRGVAALPAAPKALFGEIMLLGRQWSELAEAVLTDDAGGSFELGKLQNAVVFVADNADDDNGARRCLLAWCSLVPALTAATPCCYSVSHRAYLNFRKV